MPFDSGRERKTVVDISTIDGWDPRGGLPPLEPSRAQVAVTVLSVLAMLFLAIVIAATDGSASTPLQPTGYASTR